ncbi:MAG TPA: hypothetical protein VFB96_24440 [Pirellulaceae bacterium]|nr:hypothetical protein [Pirellulaceae bacterium]
MTSSSHWQPPDDPDPHAILHETHADLRAARYETALAKHVWFHRHALTYNPGLGGVRLSFALGCWRELGKAYPPALAKLKEFRDEAASDVVHGKNPVESFHDVAAINRYLGLEEDTTKLFVYLDALDSTIAKSVYRLAQPALVKQKRFDVCGKYLEPKQTLALEIDAFRFTSRFPGRRKYPQEHRVFAEKSFSHHVQTLVGLLVVNTREAEAREIAALAKAEWEDSAFLSGIDRALAGWVPDPWP